MKKFIAGILSYAAVQSLEQDAIGKEAYLRFADIGWISAWITVPFRYGCKRGNDADKNV